jgi:hypothetical protein
MIEKSASMLGWVVSGLLDLIAKFVPRLPQM